MLGDETHDLKEDGEMFSKLNPCYSIEDILTYEDTHLGTVFVMLTHLLGVYLKFIVHKSYFHVLSYEWALYQ